MPLVPKVHSEAVSYRPCCSSLSSSLNLAIQLRATIRYAHPSLNNSRTANFRQSSNSRTVSVRALESNSKPRILIPTSYFIKGAREGTAFVVPKKPRKSWALAFEKTPSFWACFFMRQVRVVFQELRSTHLLNAPNSRPTQRSCTVKGFTAHCDPHHSSAGRRLPVPWVQSCKSTKPQATVCTGPFVTLRQAASCNFGFSTYHVGAGERPAGTGW